LRRFLGLPIKGRPPKGVQVTQWIGFSVDEASRAGNPHNHQPKYITTTYPLLDLGMSRQDCGRWLSDRGFPVPPKSACVGCPYRGNAEWRRLAADAPDVWAEAKAFDRAIRNLGGMRGQCFIHRDGVPLSEQAIGHGQLLPFGEFFEECTGFCGT
jgi:hypothetical protein